MPRTLLANRGYVMICAFTLLLLGINITVEIALPLLLSEVNGLSPSLVGLVLVPQAAALVVFGPLAGRLTDRFGVSGPARIGVVSALVAILALSAFGVGSPAWVAGALAVATTLGATLARVATTVGVSLAVDAKDLASGIALVETCQWLGVSIGTALFTAALSMRSGAAEALNPLHVGAGAGYSDAFLALVPPLLAALLVSWWFAGFGKRARGVRRSEGR